MFANKPDIVKMRNMHIELEKIWVQKTFYFGGPTKLPWVLHF